MSKLTHNLLKRLDYSLIQVKREENFAALHKALGKMNHLQINFPEAPFMYPLYLENGMKIKKELINRRFIFLHYGQMYLKSLKLNIVHGIIQKISCHFHAINVIIRKIWNIWQV